MTGSSGMFILFCLALLAACGRSEPDIAVADLPPYTESEARVYDDSIAAEVFDAELASAKQTPLFLERVQNADFIVQVRLIAINAKRSDEAVLYQLVMLPRGESLVGTLYEDPLELSVSRGSPSQAMLRAMDTQLVGTELIVLARRFQHQGEMVVHFRLEPDTVGIRQAVQEALTSKDKAPNSASIAESSP